MNETDLIPGIRIERRIFILRGHKVMLDFDLAELYHVETKVLNQAVKRNIERFPSDFMFRLSEQETALVMRSQIVTSSDINTLKSTAVTPSMRSQVVTASKRNIRFRPYAFTEQGVAMLSSVLGSHRAIQVNIAIVRTFVQLRQLLSTHADLSRKLAAMEKRYDSQFKIVFEAIHELMKPVAQKKTRREIGFHANPLGQRSRSAIRATANISV